MGCPRQKWRSCCPSPPTLMTSWRGGFPRCWSPSSNHRRGMHPYGQGVLHQAREPLPVRHHQGEEYPHGRGAHHPALRRPIEHLQFPVSSNPLAALHMPPSELLLLLRGATGTGHSCSCAARNDTGSGKGTDITGLNFLMDLLGDLAGRGAPHRMLTSSTQAVM